MKIFIGADHAGFEMKEALKPFLEELGHGVVDHGADEYNIEDDYPDFIIPVAKDVAQAEGALGIVIGGSGQGEAIAANRLKGVRAVVFNGQYEPRDGREVPDEVILTREHNDANILSLGARFLSIDDAKRTVTKWLATPFSADARHVRRLEKVDNL